MLCFVCLMYWKFSCHFLVKFCLSTCRKNTCRSDVFFPLHFSQPPFIVGLLDEFLLGWNSRFRGFFLSLSLGLNTWSTMMRYDGATLLTGFCRKVQINRVLSAICRGLVFFSWSFFFFSENAGTTTGSKIEIKHNNWLSDSVMYVNWACVWESNCAMSLQEASEHEFKYNRKMLFFRLFVVDLSRKFTFFDFLIFFSVF